MGILMPLVTPVYQIDTGAHGICIKIRAILERVGKWVQYSYHLGNGHHKSATHFQRLASKIVRLNLPPARVNVYQK